MEREKVIMDRWSKGRPEEFGSEKMEKKYFG